MDYFRTTGKKRFAVFVTFDLEQKKRPGNTNRKTEEKIIDAAKQKL